MRIPTPNPLAPAAATLPMPPGDTPPPGAPQPAPRPDLVRAEDDPRLQHLLALATSQLPDTDPSHDLGHLARVMASVRRLAPPAGADLRVALPAALLHDLINVPKHHPDRAAASTQSAAAADALLAEAGYLPDERAGIRQAIIEHSFSKGLAASSPESAVLQDADRLDALGAIGIFRTVTCGARMGARYYAATDPWAHTRALDDRAHTLDHFEVKLLHLAAGFNTAAGRAEAEQRTAFMRAFLAQLRQEISGQA